MTTDCASKSAWALPLTLTPRRRPGSGGRSSIPTAITGFSPDQREAWRRLAPILALLDLGEWQDDERRALVDLIRAKGGCSERDYLAGYQAHARLDAALRQGGQGQGEPATGRLHQVARPIS